MLWLIYNCNTKHYKLLVKVILGSQNKNKNTFFYFSAWLCPFTALGTYVSCWGTLRVTRNAWALSPLYVIHDTLREHVLIDLVITCERAVNKKWHSQQQVVTPSVRGSN